jgi:hypothetical protein
MTVVGKLRSGKGSVNKSRRNKSKNMKKGIRFKIIKNMIVYSLKYIFDY